MIDKRLTELDGLRGIAAISVVLFHYFFRYDHIYGHAFDVPNFFRFGHYGVQLFFMISGFVIYWTISRSARPMDFVWSRLSRLYPVYWASIGATFLFVWMFSLPGREYQFIDFLVNLSMFQEYIGFPHIDGVYWTLTIELTFYIWILFLFCIGQVKNIEKILVAWIVLSAIISFRKFGFVIDENLKKIFLLDYIEFFAAGICFYKYKNKQHTLWTHILLSASLCSVCISYMHKNILLLLCFYVVFALILINKAGVLRNTVIVYLGALSYSLYLVHQNIGYVIINEFYRQELNPIIGILAAVLFSIGLAHFLMTYIERPSLRFLREYYKKRKEIQSSL